MPHIHEKIDFTAEVFIVNDNKVLLRMHDKYKIWLSVGGHIELDEDPVEAALREVKEEVGLNVKIFGNKPDFNDPEYTSIITPQFIGKNFVTPTHQHITFVYFATCDTTSVGQSISNHEQAETKWVSKEELATMDLKPNIRFFALQALETLSQ